VTENLGVVDQDRVKIWVRRYRKLGEASFIDRIGNPHRVESEEYRNFKWRYVTFRPIPPKKLAITYDTVHHIIYKANLTPIKRTRP